MTPVLRHPLLSRLGLTALAAGVAFSVAPAQAVAVIDNLSAPKVQDSPIYLTGDTLVSPFSSFKTGGSSSFDLKTITVSLSSFGSYSFDDLTISLFGADALGNPEGSSLSSVTVGGFINAGVTCTGGFGAEWCQDFTYDLTSFSSLAPNSNYAIQLSRTSDYGGLFWDFAGAPGGYSTALGFTPLLSGNPVNDEGKDPRFHIYQLDADPDSVPGPLPLLGAAAAYGYSRKLRRRIQSSKLPVASAID